MPYSVKELKTNFKELGSINEKQEKRVRHLETTTIILVVAYIFFQAIIFFSVSQRPTISCQHWWIPFCLSFLIAFIFAITFQRFVTKWERTQYHYDMNFMERELIHHRIVSLQRSNGSSSDQQPTILKCDKVKVYQRYAFIYLVSIALIAYTILILKACRSNLCRNK